jgi:hypothetical protein
VWLVNRVIFLVMYALGDGQTPCILTGDVGFGLKITWRHRYKQCFFLQLPFSFSRFKWTKNYEIYKAYNRNFSKLPLWNFK